ncbi:MAG: PD-(D/E)XK nuclease family protein [Verrucomicrobiales bacterium]|nr:PD-(D/E)XK nuclease family protein [Verrucomicrobiales bacterium]
MALDPAQCLQALDDLGRAGWSGEEADLGEVPSPAREWLRVLAASDAWAPVVDEKLKIESRKLNLGSGNNLGFPPLQLCFWAWDRELGTEHSLLVAALAAARETVLFLPAPLEDVEFNWLAELQNLCGSEVEVCAESGFASANEELTEHLFRRGETLPVTRLPRVLVGATEADELALLEREVWRCLEAGGAGGSIGVVFPARGVLARRLARRLLAAGAPVFDHGGDALPVDWSAEVQQKLAAYYLYGCQVDDFLALAVAWRAGGGAVEPARWRWRLKDAFRLRQTRHVPALLAGAAADDEAGALARALGKWPERAEWRALKDRWQRAARLLGGSTEGLEPLWSRLDPVLAGRVIAGRAFLEYVGGLLKSARAARAGAEVFARIEIVTPRQAAGRTWGHLIFAESNEGRWPPAVTENPFLTDAARTALNRRRGARGWLFTTGERALLDDKRLRDTLENCAGTTTFTASATDATRPDQPLYPNGLVARLLALRDGGGTLAAWRKSVVSVSAPPVVDPLDVTERARLAVIAEHRRDPRRAFDEYSFCYPAKHAAGLQWSVTKLEDIANCPATAALSLLFNAEAAGDDDFTRSESWFAGVLAHDWIKRCLADGVPPLTLMPARLAEVGAALRRELNISGLWLETAFRSARWMADELLTAAYAEGLAESPSATVERAITGVVRTAAGPLSLKGRMDLVLADGDAWRVFDFKTGKQDAPTPRELARGEGLQFGAYLLLALAAGAKSATVQCLSPKRSESRTLTMSEVEAAEQGLARAAFAQRKLCFGLGAGKFRNEWRERLPLAFTPIDLAVLEQKSRLTFGAGGDAGEAGDE